MSDFSTELANLVELAHTHIVRVDARGHRGVTGVAYGPRAVVTSARGLPRGSDVRLSFHDRVVPAQVVGRDFASDVALLEFEPGTTAPQVPTWRDASDLRLGEFALAVARPGHTARAALACLGVVGDAFRTARGGIIDRYLELDRELPRGFGGSLLLDAEARAIGFTTTGLVRGTMLALPATTIHRVVDQLRVHGHVPRGYLGVGVFQAQIPQQLAAQIGQEHAVAVIGLEEDGPAARGGVQVGDLIVSVAGHAVRSPHQLRDALFDQGAISTKVRVLRAGAPCDLEVSIDSRP